MVDVVDARLGVREIEALSDLKKEVNELFSFVLFKLEQFKVEAKTTMDLAQGEMINSTLSSTFQKRATELRNMLSNLKTFLSRIPDYSDTPALRNALVNEVRIRKKENMRLDSLNEKYQTILNISNVAIREIRTVLVKTVSKYEDDAHRPHAFHLEEREEGEENERGALSTRISQLLSEINEEVSAVESNKILLLSEDADYDDCNIVQISLFAKSNSTNQSNIPLSELIHPGLLLTSNTEDLSLADNFDPFSASHSIKSEISTTTPTRQNNIALQQLQSTAYSDQSNDQLFDMPLIDFSDIEPPPAFSAGTVLTPTSPAPPPRPLKNPLPPKSIDYSSSSVDPDSVLLLSAANTQGISSSLKRVVTSGMKNSLKSSSPADAAVLSPTVAALFDQRNESANSNTGLTLTLTPASPSAPAAATPTAVTAATGSRDLVDLLLSPLRAHPPPPQPPLSSTRLAAATTAPVTNNISSSERSIDMASLAPPPRTLPISSGSSDDPTFAASDPLSLSLTHFSIAPSTVVLTTTPVTCHGPAIGTNMTERHQLQEELQQNEEDKEKEAVPRPLSGHGYKFALIRDASPQMQQLSNENKMTFVPHPDKSTTVSNLPATAAIAPQVQRSLLPVPADVATQRAPAAVAASNSLDLDSLLTSLRQNCPSVACSAGAATTTAVTSSVAATAFPPPVVPSLPLSSLPSLAAPSGIDTNLAVAMASFQQQQQQNAAATAIFVAATAQQAAIQKALMSHNIMFPAFSGDAASSFLPPHLLLPAPQILPSGFGGRTPWQQQQQQPIQQPAEISQFFPPTVSSCQLAATNFMARANIVELDSLSPGTNTGGVIASQTRPNYVNLPSSLTTFNTGSASTTTVAARSTNLARSSSPLAIAISPPAMCSTSAVSLLSGGTSARNISIDESELTGPVVPPSLTVAAPAQTPGTSPQGGGGDAASSLGQSQDFLLPASQSLPRPACLLPSSSYSTFWNEMSSSSAQSRPGQVQSQPIQIHPPPATPTLQTATKNLDFSCATPNMSSGGGGGGAVASAMPAAVRIKTCHLTKDEPFLCVISCILSPLDFYVMRYTPAYAQMEKEISNIYSNDQLAPNSFTAPPPIGTFCVAKYDGDWYRGKVRSKNDPNFSAASSRYTSTIPSVGIHFVDYGNNDIVAVKDVKPLLPEFGQLECGSFHAKLADLEFSDGWEEATNVDGHTVGQLFKEINIRKDDENNYVCVLPERLVGKVVEVFIFLMDLETREIVCLNQLLIDDTTVVSWKDVDPPFVVSNKTILKKAQDLLESVVPAASKRPPPPQQQSKSEVVSLHALLENDDSEVNHMPVKLLPPTSGDSPGSALFDDCFGDANELHQYRLQHQLQRQDQEMDLPDPEELAEQFLLRSTPEKKLACESLDKIEIGDDGRVKVLPTHVDGPEKFFVRIVNPRSQQAISVIENELKEQSRHLQILDKMQRYLHGSNAQEIAVNDCVMAPAKVANGRLYRAKVIEKRLLKSGKMWAEIQYMDYGNKTRMACSRLYPCPRHLTDVPRQAYWCRLPSNFTLLPERRVDANKLFIELCGMDLNLGSDGEMENQNLLLGKISANNDEEAVLTGHFALQIDLIDGHTHLNFANELVRCKFGFFNNLEAYRREKAERQRQGLDVVEGEMDDEVPEGGGEGLLNDDDNDEAEMLRGFDPMTSDYFSERNNYEESDDLDVAITGRKVQQRQCRFWLRKKSCPFGNGCFFLHEAIDPIFGARSSIGAFKLINEGPPRLSFSHDCDDSGRKTNSYSLKVTSVTSPSSFYVVRMCEKEVADDNAAAVEEAAERSVESGERYDEDFVDGGEAVRLCRDLEFEDIHSFHSRMQVHYQSEQLALKTSILSSPGEIVVVRLSAPLLPSNQNRLLLPSSPRSGDSYSYKWVRAKVIASLLNEEVEVFYIDFGFTEEVKVSSICPIDISFCHLPPQAIHCRLHNCLPAAFITESELRDKNNTSSSTSGAAHQSCGSWTTEATEMFKDLVKETDAGQLKGVFYEDGHTVACELLSVDLAIQTPAVRINIASRLRQKGLARCDIAPWKQSILPAADTTKPIPG